MGVLYSGSGGAVCLCKCGSVWGYEFGKVGLRVSGNTWQGVRPRDVTNEAVYMEANLIFRLAGKF